LAERNIYFDHSTLNPWVLKYSQQLEANLEQEKVKWQSRGDWLRSTQKLKRNGFTTIELMINICNVFS
tara:strand:+ start:232 stop:435 length:204 start_codon:yes stop_codon:yes gene_type:complete